jgi:eukaryotic-like serine/threonine-protein kinase
MSYEFGEFRLDPGDCTLLRAGVPVPLTPKAFDTLLLLVEHRGRLVDKELMMQRLWPDAVVEEANLANNISALRKALGESGNLIQTVPRRGYKFIGQIRDDAPTTENRPPTTRRSLWLAAVAVPLALAFGLLAGRALWRREPPRFTQLTFRRGPIWGARFTPDGQTVVYSASYEGKPSELFVANVNQTTSRPLGAGSAHLLAISRRGELALMLRPHEMAFASVDMLAQMPISGGAPREITDDVQEADWSPDERLAVIRWPTSVVQLEWPIGHVLYKASPPAWLSCLRVSPDGKAVAFLLHESARFDDRGRAVIIEGNDVTRSREFASANGLTWRGNELVISASDDGNNGLWAIDRRGRARVLTRGAARLALFDAAPDGSLLVARETTRAGILAHAAGESGERELSWLDGSWLRDLSADGRTLLFDEEGIAGGSTARVCIRGIDGSPAVDLGAGHALALSPDGRWALARQRFTHPPRLVLIPTGAGQARVLPTPGIVPNDRASWLPDSRRFLFPGNRRTWLYDITTNRLKAVTPRGVIGVINDGTYLAARRQLWPIAGGAPKPIPSLTPDDLVVRLDGRSAIVDGAQSIDRIDLATGRRERLQTFGAQKPAGAVYASPPCVSADARTYAWTYASIWSELFVVEGAR